MSSLLLNLDRDLLSRAFLNFAGRASVLTVPHSIILRNLRRHIVASRTVGLIRFFGEIIFRL